MVASYAPSVQVWVSGKEPEELLAEAENAVVVDVRVKPWSRVPGWSQKALQALLGERYVWVRELGNEDYKGMASPGVRRDAKGAAVRLVDEQAGLAKVREILERQAVILLCFEADERECHRMYVKQRLAGEPSISREGAR